MNIAGSNHGNIVWHVQACILNRFHRANGNGIVETENSVKHGTHAEKLLHALIAGLIPVASAEDVTRVGAKFVFRQGAAIAFETFRGDSNFRPAQVTYAAAS